MKYPSMSRPASADKLWGGRFQAPTHTLVEDFNASVKFDYLLWEEDITASFAHLSTLQRAGVIDDTEFATIAAGLKRIRQEITDGVFSWSPTHEDVHTNIEQRLIALIGDVGKKLHTGRSRNDQVATDLRLFLRGKIDATRIAIVEVQNAIIALAEQHIETILPGYTHLQHAQPITFAHHLLAWWEMIERDDARLVDCRKRVNQSPLGAAALAGSGYPLNRDFTAQQLGFAAPMGNSVDAVSARDFAVEYCAAAAMLMVHLSRWSEEVILWSSSHFRYITFADAFCTGSSIMPQKKNPDIPELVRGKCGRVIGNLNALLVILKAQPLAYNKDNQEDKEALFDSVSTVLDCLHIWRDLLAHITVNREIMYAQAQQGFLTATDLADHLVSKGVPFRDAHTVVGRLVAHAIKHQVTLDALSAKTLQDAHPAITSDVFDALSLQQSIKRRDVIGGTAPTRVRTAWSAARARTREKHHELRKL